MSNPIRWITLSTLLTLVLASTLAAQPPGGRGGFSGRGGPGGGFPGRGGPGGGFPGRGGGDSDRGRGDRGGDDRGRDYGRDRGGYDRSRDFDPTSMLSRLDANKNGKLDPNELSDRMRQFVAPRMEAIGIDISKSVSIKKISEAYQKSRNPGADSSDGGVPGFGVEPEFTSVPSFEVEFGSALSAIGSLDERYQERVLQRAEQTISRYDRNKDGILDSREIREGRWRGDPLENDLNKDGKLTRVELAERYVVREAEEAKERERRSSSGGGDSGQDWRSRWANASEEERNKMREEMRARWSGGRGGSGDSSRGGDSRGGDSRGGDSRGGDSRGSSSRSERGSDDRGRDERERSSKDEERRSERKSSSSPDEMKERYSKYVDSIFRSKDKDENGKLDSEEIKALGSAIDAKAADEDGNGELTKEEVLGSLLKRAEKSSSGSKRSSSDDRSSASKQRSVYQRVSVATKLEDMGVDSDFIKLDKNRDGQIQMSEFTSRWTQAKYEEFQEIDTSGDGVISPAEWLGE